MLTALPMAAAAIGQDFELLDTPAGDPTLRVCGEDGSWVLLHSPEDPRREGADFVPEQGVPGDEPVVLLGLGLGYAALALAESLPPGRPLLIVEASPKVHELSRTHGVLQDLESRPGIRVLAGEAPDRAGRALGGRPAQVLRHAPSMQAFPAYYRQLSQGFRSARSRPTAPSRRRLSQQTLDIALFTSEYHLVRECRHALEKLGHRVVAIAPPDETSGPAWLRQLIDALAKQPPDFLLTINHLGFDAEGVMTRTLTHLGIPQVSWYVDSPTAILPNVAPLVSELSYVASWDRAYVPVLESLGFPHVGYLPLATSDRYFGPRSPEACEPFARPLAFVGDSMSRPVARWTDKAGGPEQFARIDAAAAKLRRDPDATPPRSDGGVESAFETAVVLRATQRRRAELLRSVADLDLTVWGDAEGWRSQLPDTVRLERNVAYYRELAEVYAGTELSLNATSLQMPRAPNQRVFDVPACGGFVLTDDQADLPELLQPGREVICYRNADELRDLTRFYLARPRARREITRAAQRRIAAEHRYEHRLAQLIETLRERFAC